MTNEEFDKILDIPVTKKETLQQLINLQKESGKLDIICNAYGITNEVLISEYETEILISGMTVGIAFNAISFLAVQVEKKENNQSIKQAIRDNILAAGVYMTNVPAKKRWELEGRV